MKRRRSSHDAYTLKKNTQCSMIICSGIIGINFSKSFFFFWLTTLVTLGMELNLSCFDMLLLCLSYIVVVIVPISYTIVTEHRKREHLGQFIIL